MEIQMGTDFVPDIHHKWMIGVGVFLICMLFATAACAFYMYLEKDKALLQVKQVQRKLDETQKQIDDAEAQAKADKEAKLKAEEEAAANEPRKMSPADIQLHKEMLRLIKFGPDEDKPRKLTDGIDSPPDDNNSDHYPVKYDMIPGTTPLANYQFIANRNKRLSYLTHMCVHIDVVPKAQGPLAYLFRPSENDPRRLKRGSSRIIMFEEDPYPGILEYGKTNKTPNEYVQQIQTSYEKNYQMFINFGPPYFHCKKAMDFIAMDSYPRYLYNICVIDEKMLEKMELLMKPKYPRALHDSEYTLLTCSYESQDTFNKYFERLFTKTMDNLNKIKNMTVAQCTLTWMNKKGYCEFETLVAFFKLYPQYVQCFKLMDAHLWRMPLQGLLLQYMREGLTTGMRKKIFYWFKLTSFGMLRVVGDEMEDKVSGVMYPMNYLLKLRSEHAFPRMQTEQFKSTARTLAGAKMKMNSDWCIGD